MKQADFIKKTDVKWLQMDNYDGSATLSQHALKGMVRFSKYYGAYDSNISLCGKVSAMDENEVRAAIATLDDEPLNEKEACKLCLRIYNKLP